MVSWKLGRKYQDKDWVEKNLEVAHGLLMERLNKLLDQSLANILSINNNKTALELKNVLGTFKANLFRKSGAIMAGANKELQDMEVQYVDPNAIKEEMLEKYRSKFPKLCDAIELFSDVKDIAQIIGPPPDDVTANISDDSTSSRFLNRWK